MNTINDNDDQEVVNLMTINPHPPFRIISERRSSSCKQWHYDDYNSNGIIDNTYFTWDNCYETETKKRDGGLLKI